MRRILATTLLIALSVPAAAFADEGGGSATLTLQGEVNAVCALTPVSEGANVFTIGGGSLINTQTGQLATGLATDGAKTITGSWCNAPSTITLSATPLTTPFSGAVPANFTRAVNYTAAMTGWTTLNTATIANNQGTPASASNSANVGSPTASDIVVDLNTFTAPGGARPVAGTYNATITVTLAVQ